MTQRSTQTQAAPAAASATSSRALLVLVALGAAAALWALFLWWELVSLRSGGTPFCAVGGALDCAAVWDGPLASAVHAFTGVPIAGWGLAWGVVALLLPLLARTRQNQGRPAPELLSATRLTAAAGLVTVVVMIAASVSERALCLGCVGTYLLVLGYAFMALWNLRATGWPDLGRAAAAALGLTLGAYLLLVYPGQRTPRKGDDAGRAAVAAAAGQPSSAAVATPSVAQPAVPGPATTDAPARPTAPGSGKLADFIAALPLDQQQALSNALFVYRNQPPRSVPPARALLGKLAAPVRITEFTDVLCSHCADLHETLATLRAQLPPDSFSVEPRQFPLDGECNRSVRMRGLPQRCLGAKALICMEGRPEADVLAGVLFERQRQLQPEMVYELASPYVPRAQLERCIADPATQSKLDSDVALAESYGITGTPLVLINGRQGSPSAPFLYAMVLTKGSAQDPAFDLLPPPSLGAPGHDGHAH